MRSAHSFLTQAYKAGYIHTHVAADGSDVIRAQIDTSTKDCRTFAGAQRWITKAMQSKPNH